MTYTFTANGKVFSANDCGTVVNACVKANAHFRKDNLPSGSWVESGSKTSFRWVAGNLWD